MNTRGSLNKNRDGINKDKDETSLNLNPLYLATSEKNSNNCSQHQKFSTLPNEKTKINPSLPYSNSKNKLNILNNSFESDSNVSSLVKIHKKDQLNSFVNTNKDEISKLSSKDNVKTKTFTRTLDTSSLTSKKTVKEQNIAAINVPENIVFCIDLSKEMQESFFVNKSKENITYFTCVKKALAIFMNTKIFFHSGHQFTLVFFTNTSIWISDFTSNAKELLNILTNMEENIENDLKEIFNISELLDTILLSCKFPLTPAPSNSYIPSFSFRVILIYARSQCLPDVKLKQNQEFLKDLQHFVIDVLYIYNSISESTKSAEIFYNLCELDFRGTSYIFSVDSLKKIYDCMFQLLAHPFQRLIQQDATYII